MENQHRLIKTYRELSQDDINSMNAIKALEASVGVLFQEIDKLEGVDHRHLALARTNLQQGFMWFVRAIAQPADPFVSGE